MRDAKKRGSGAIGTAVAAKASGMVKDPRAQALVKMGTALGNKELQQKIAKGNATRDELLAFLAHRLETMRNVQLKELEKSGKQPMMDKWKEIADTHKESYKKPDPMRWGKAARLYEIAAQALEQGNIRRGRQNIERAMEAEKEAMNGVSKHVLEALGDDVDVEVERPSALEEPDEVAEQSKESTDAVELAKEIQLVNVDIAEPPNKKRAYDPWWTLEEEEEEEEAGGGGA